MTKALRAIEIFRAGKWTPASGTPLTFSADDVRAIAAAYDPALHEAPIVVGHPADNAPAYGWVASLNTSPEAVLLAEPTQVDQAFADAVNARRYKKISVSLYEPDSPSNPVPGTYYLRHVGFLGAVPPAVKGLRDAVFAAGEEGIVELSAPLDHSSDGLWRRLRDWFEAESPRQDDVPSSVFAEPVPAVTPTPEQTPTTENDMALAAAQQAELDKKAAELAEKEKAQAAREIEFAERTKAADAKEAAARREVVVQFVEGLVQDGCRVLPGDKAPLVELLSTMPVGATLAFAEAGKAVSVPSRTWLETWLKRLPQQVDFAERAAAGAEVDTDNPEAVAKLATKYRAEQAAVGIEVRFCEAVRHVTAGR